MRRTMLVLCLSVISTLCAAQGPSEKTLNELLIDLPSVGHKNRLDLPLYGSQIEEAYKRDPASLEAAIPLFIKNLSSNEPWVQLECAVLIQVLAMDSNNPKFVLHFTDQLAGLIDSSDEYTRGAAINAVSILTQAMPDNVVQSLLATVNDKNSPYRVYSAAVPALLLARPNDTQVEGVVLSAISDTARTEEQRCNLLSAAGGAGRLAGQSVVDYVVSVVNTSPDIRLRNSAVDAAESMGLRALNRVTSKLQTIAGDPNELPASRESAAHALKVQAHSAR